MYLPHISSSPQKSHLSAGFVMPVLLFTITFVMTIIAAAATLGVTNYNLANREVYKVNAQLAADAGLDAALNQVNSNPSWLGTGSEVQVMNSNNVRTTYTTTVQTTSPTKKTIDVVSRAYFPAASSTPKIIRRYAVDIEAVTSGTGLTSVVSGVGGLVLNSNSKITGGDVVVNGTVTVNNNAQIGLSTTPLANAVNLRVAHTNCPTPATSAYPRVCGTGENGQPISIGTNGRIYADVRATNQTNGSGMSNPGLVPGQTVPPTTLPDYDRAAQKAAVSQTLTPTSSTIACGNNETKTWPANAKITGNIMLGNNCTVNLSGNVWITGKLDFGTNSRLIVPNSLGSTMPVIMVDGSGGLTISNNGSVVANNVGTGIYFIAYWSNAGCSPDCTTVTGTELKNSQDLVRVNLANNGSAPGSILYARWSRTQVSNNGSIGAVAGQSIELGNNAVINFTASVPGSDNLTQTWVKRGYMRVFN